MQKKCIETKGVDIKENEWVDFLVDFGAHFRGLKAQAAYSDVDLYQ